MPELRGRELLEEWRGVMESLLATAGLASGPTELAHELQSAMRRQFELMQEVIDGERRLQRELAGRVLAPLDMVFGLLEQSGASLRSQAAALAAAGQALTEVARLIEAEAEVFERTIGALRQPAEVAKAAAGLPGRRSK